MTSKDKSAKVERLAKRLKDQHERWGLNTTYTDAHKKAVEIAEKSDREKSESRGQ